jgi:hypothetical protein
MMSLAPVTNWEPHGVKLAGYCYGMRHGMKVQIVTPYRVSYLQRYGVTIRGNVTSVPTLICSIRIHITNYFLHQYSETNVMQFLFSLLRIMGLYMFRTLLAHLKEALHLVYCVRVMSVGCTRIKVEL